MEHPTESDAAQPPLPDEATDSAPIAPARHGWLRETAIVFGFYYVYQTIRSVADAGNSKNRAYANARWLVNVEKRMSLFHEQAIQNALLGARWFIRIMNIYYGTLHFVITAGLLVWLYMRRHHAYRRMRNLLGVTTGLAIIGYWSFPLAPPRLYLECDVNMPVLGPEGGLVQPDCFVDTLDKIGGLWSYHSPVAKAVANQYAAMPSLHFGWALWCGIVLVRYAQHRGMRVFGYAYPLLTLFAIVVTANHYFLDAAGGTVLLLAAIGLLRVTSRRAERQTAAATNHADAAAPARDPDLEVAPSPR